MYESHLNFEQHGNNEPEQQDKIEAKCDFRGRTSRKCLEKDETSVSQTIPFKTESVDRASKIENSNNIMFLFFCVTY